MIWHRTIEVNVTRHCNNRCVACNHASAFAPKYEMAADVLARDLADLRTVFHADECWVLGGEPLLHPKLTDLLRVAWDSHIAGGVCVLTNGRLLDRMTDEFWELVSRVKVSVYPNLDRAILDRARATAEAHYVDFEAVEYNAFFKIFGKVDPETAFDGCPWRRQCWTVHEGHFHLCPESAFFPAAVMGQPDLQEGLPLAGITEPALEAYVERTKPFAACAICDSYGETLPWRESKTRAEWVRDSGLVERPS